LPLLVLGQRSVIFLMKRKYHGYKVYLHNFSNFDGVYLLKIISSLSNKINIIIKDTKIINLQIKFVPGSPGRIALA